MVGCAMKLWKYYLLSWVSGILTLIFSVGGALAFVTYMSGAHEVDGVVRQGHMSVMEFVLPLFLIGLVCFILYLCISFFCVFRKLTAEQRRLLHFLLNLFFYLATVVGTIPLMILLFN